ncbi:MAG: phosphotransferase [Gammaproteobacteria bacterium]|nr:phosphotransferase [Gammaproteobacteria bacterium]
MHNRQSALNKWLEKKLGSSQFSINLLAGDASCRRYFRLHHNDLMQIIMDAPPNKETIEPFLTVAALLNKAGVRTPKIYDFDINQGFAILDDLGDTLLLNKLSPETADRLYREAIDTLIVMQSCPSSGLPYFDQQFILSELTIFKEWFLQAYLKIEITSKEESLLNETFAWLSNKITQQPQVFIHRDYHSRNIMLLNNNDKLELGIIDFQDAMRGPFGYDLVSLLKDCYIQWPREKIMAWLTYFYNQTEIAKQYSLPAFIRAFDYCGLQRHLKILGVFSRLYLRDNKPNYLQDLPLTLNYVMASLECHDELQPFYQFIQNRIRLP